LRDLGAVDPDGLERATRGQVAEILLDSFGWTDGDYVFVTGPPSTAERTTLARAPEVLLAEGVRRVVSWTRLVRGCGGVDNRQRATARLAEVVDKIGGGAEERRLAASLDKPWTLRRLCRATDVDDVRVCQIVWTLRLLGAVEDFPDEEDLDDGAEDAPSVMAAAAADELRARLRELPERAEHSLTDDWNLPGAVTNRGAAAEIRLELDADWVEPAPPVQVSAEPAWAGPPDLDDVVARFNAMHRVVFRAVRTEVGAGAANFVRSCCDHVGSECRKLFDGVELAADGSWDVDGLKHVVRAAHVEDPWSQYQRVLDQLYNELTPHLGQARAAALRDKVLALEAPAAAARPDQSSR
jgi:hypothetical protein